MNLFYFWKADGGTKDAPITYKNAPGAKVRFFGGFNLKPTDFTALKDETFRSRLVNWRS